MLEPCWHYFSLLGPLGSIWRILLRFLSLWAGFCGSWTAPGSILESFRKVWEGFWKSQGLIFRVLFARASFQCEKACDVQKPQFFLGFSRFFTYRKLAAQAKKTTQNRSRSLSHTAANKDCAENSFWRSQRWVLEGSEAVLASSLAPLGRPLGTLGQLWGPLECFSGTSWLVLGASCANLSSQGPPRPRFWRVWGRSRLGFQEFGGHNLTYFLLRIALCYLMFF